MTAGTATGRAVTPGHPPAFSTLRNARSAEWLAATRESRPRRDPVRCEACGYHLGETTTTDTTEGARHA